MKKIILLLTISLVTLQFSIVAMGDDESTEKYMMIMESNRDAGIAAFNKALNFEKQKDLVKAVGSYTQSIRLYPRIKEAYNNLAAVYFELGIYEKAIENYQKAIDLDPDYFIAYVNLGIAYYALQRFDSAIESLKAGRRGLPHLKDLLYFLARSLCHKGNYIASIGVFKELLDLDPTYYPAHFDIASIYMVENKFNKALSHFKTVEMISPNHENIVKIRKIIGAIQRLDLSKIEVRNSV